MAEDFEPCVPAQSRLFRLRWRWRADVSKLYA